MKHLTILFFLFLSAGTYAQTGIGTTAPHASAQLEVSSTSKGFLPPRMTTEQRDNISNPATGLIIYNTTTNILEYKIESGWVSLISNPDGATKNYVDELIAALEARIVGLEAIVPPAIGDFRDGGVVFYVAPVPTDLNGDGILDKGLVCAVEDQSTSFIWYDNNNFGARYSTGIGTGAQNSKDFLEYSDCTNCAIYLASQYAGGGFNDWFLPSRDELAEVYRYRNFINLTALANGGSSLSDASYWSSSIYNPAFAYYPWWLDFSFGSSSSNGGFTAFRSIRAVRAF
jgi:hypothetical protein